jgi:hypothetical protein
LTWGNIGLSCWATRTSSQLSSCSVFVLQGAAGPRSFPLAETLSIITKRQETDRERPSKMSTEGQKRRRRSRPRCSSVPVRPFSFPSPLPVSSLQQHQSPPIKIRFRYNIRSLWVYAIKGISGNTPHSTKLIAPRTQGTLIKATPNC